MHTHTTHTIHMHTRMHTHTHTHTHTNTPCLLQAISTGSLEPISVLSAKRSCSRPAASMHSRGKLTLSTTTIKPLEVEWEKMELA